MGFLTEELISQFFNNSGPIPPKKIIWELMSPNFYNFKTIYTNLSNYLNNDKNLVKEMMSCSLILLEEIVTIFMENIIFRKISFKIS